MHVQELNVLSILYKLRLREAIIQSKKEGIKEGKIEVAKKLLENGMDVVTISQITGILEEEIRHLI